MKRLITKASLVFAATMLIAVGMTSSARADERVITKAQVPFPFIVGNVRLPAGHYVVKEVASGSGVLEVASPNGRECALSITISSPAEHESAAPKLVFEKFGNEHFLARVVPWNGDERDIILTPASMERQLVKAAEHSGH